MNDKLLQPPPPEAPGAGPARQALLFQWLRARLLRNSTSVLLEHSSLRLVSIVLCSVLVWGSVYVLSAWGFSFVARQQIAFAGGIVETLFDFLFLSLAVMLIFSGGIILYGSLFNAAETAFLLSTPAHGDQVFAYKFQTAVGFSSWAFLLLGSPILIAYGLTYGVPWYFYALLPLFFIGFVLLPGSVGAIVCLLLVNFFPRRKRQVLALGVVALLVLLGLFLYRLIAWGRDTTNTELFYRLLDQFAFARSVLMPSHWMSRGLLTAARGQWDESLFLLGLIWGNGLFLYVLVAWASKRLYRRGYNRLATGGSLKRRAGGGWLDQAVSTLLGFLDVQTRLLIIKDFRTFRRDPSQWAQVLIFGGLMLLYFLNTRRFYQEDIGRPYQNGISLLNLAVTALLMCAYTGRFIYPMLSLEGRKFWLLGLLPLSRDRLLWGKFAFSAAATLLISGSFVLVSDLLLGVSPLALGLHVLAATMLSLGLSGMSVGLGAWMPNFRESDPSKIAVGFGGTLNLVAGLLFLIVLIGLLAGPYHFFAVTGDETRLEWGKPGFWLVLTGAVLGVALGLAAVVFPLRVGARTLRQMEF